MNIPIPPILDLISCAIRLIEYATNSPFSSTWFLSEQLAQNMQTLHLDTNTRAGPLFQAAASDGKLDVLKWGEESGYKLDNILDEDGIADVALNGYLEVVKYLRKLGISWNDGMKIHAPMLPSTVTLSC